MRSQHDFIYSLGEPTAGCENVENHEGRGLPLLAVEVLVSATLYSESLIKLNKHNRSLSCHQARLHARADHGVHTRPEQSGGVVPSRGADCGSGHWDCVFPSNTTHYYNISLCAKRARAVGES